MAVDNHYVAVAYKLYVKDEEDEQEALAEQCETTHPFQFITNMGCVLKAFEDKILPMKKGDKFDFVIPCKDAYGEVQDELILDVPRSVFEIDGRFDKEHIFEGNIIPLQGDEGERFHGTVLEVKPSSVVIDLNHPRAGQDLHFVGIVLEHREATADEITGMVNMIAGEDCCCCGEEDCGHGHHHGGHCGCHHH